MISVSKLAYSTFTHEVTVTATEDKTDALIKAASVNVDPFWPGLFAKTVANTGSLICSVGGWWASSSSGGCTAGGPAPATAAAPAEEKKVEAKTEESEKSDDDTGFGLFDYTSFVSMANKKLNL